MNNEVRDAFAAHLKYVILEYAKGIGNNRETCREFGVARSSFYEWKKAYAKDGNAGLHHKKPIAKSHPRQIPPEFIEKILHLRTKYHLGPLTYPHSFTTSNPTLLALAALSSPRWGRMGSTKIDVGC